MPHLGCWTPWRELKAVLQGSMPSKVIATAAVDCHGSYIGLLQLNVRVTLRAPTTDLQGLL